MKMKIIKMNTNMKIMNLKWRWILWIWKWRWRSNNESENNKKLNYNLDEIIGKSKSFEDQTESLKKIRRFKRVFAL